jgi:hypothetical protein
MYPLGDGDPEPVYGFVVNRAHLARFCDRLQALPAPLLSVALRGLYRLAPRGLSQAAERDSVRSAFTDQPNIEGWIVRLRCTWRVRRILEEYHFGCGPFFPFRPDSARWLAADRFIQGGNGEFWSLDHCLTSVGVRPVHRCTLPRR